MANYDQAIAALQQQVGWAARTAKSAAEGLQGQGGEIALLKQQIEQQRRDYATLAEMMSRSRAEGSGGTPTLGGGLVRYIESIPGRRIPYDMLVTLPFGATTTSEVQRTALVSQDGPFVAVARSATFQSALTFTSQESPTAQVFSFQGRSFGRFRPISSVHDFNDASAGVFQPIVPPAAPGDGAGIYASPSNHSSFRSMEWDGFIKFQNEGSGWPRQNIPVPSSMYCTDLVNPYQLAALDFFERGEVMQWLVTASHLNNPPGGNVQGLLGNFPFLPSQYDVHEGILDPGSEDETDPIVRSPDGFLIVGFHGFRIVQPPGPVRMI